MSRRLLRPWPVLLVVLVRLAPAAAADRSDWEPVQTTDDGIEVSRAPGRAAGLFEIRLATRASVPPDRLADRVWQDFQSVHRPVKRRDVLVRRPDELVIHDLVRVAVVADREYTLRIVREEAGGVLRFPFRTVPELAPPPTEGHVTLPVVQGAWEFHPDGDGTRVVYTVYSEPGSDVSSWLVRRAQLDEALRDFRRTVREAER